MPTLLQASLPLQVWSSISLPSTNSGSMFKPLRLPSIYPSIGRVLKLALNLNPDMGILQTTRMLAGRHSASGPHSLQCHSRMINSSSTLFFQGPGVCSRFVSCCFCSNSFLWFSAVHSGSITESQTEVCIFTGNKADLFLILQNY